MTRSISSIAISGFVRTVCLSFGTRARAMRSGSSVQLSGRNSRRLTITRHLARRQRYRDQRLAVGSLSERRGILWRDANRVTSLLGQRRVIDDKKTRLIANQAICLLQQGSLERSTVPNSGSDEMMKLIVADLASTCRHRLNALAVSWTNQTRDIERAHQPPRLVP